MGLIVFEGIDGSGKSTQVELIEADAKIAFPRYQKPVGKIIRFFLHLPFGQKISPYLMAFLFGFDRYLAKREINFYLQQKKLVVVDRYTGSSMAHQGAKLKGRARSKIIRWIDWLENRLFKLPQPDKVVFLNMPPEKTKVLLLKRAGKKDEAEKDFEYQKATYQVYLELAKQRKWIIIDSLNKKGKLLTPKEIYGLVKAKLNQ